MLKNGFKEKNKEMEGQETRWMIGHDKDVYLSTQELCPPFLVETLMSLSLNKSIKQSTVSPPIPSQSQSPMLEFS